MNVRSNYLSGMDDRGNLLSRLQWSGVVRVWDIQERKKVRIGEEDKPYWVIKDEYGATFLTWEPLLKNSLCIGERYACKGEIKIGKGGVFLILKIAETMETIKEQTLG